MLSLDDVQQISSRFDLLAIVCSAVLPQRIESRHGLYTFLSRLSLLRAGSRNNLDATLLELSAFKYTSSSATSDFDCDVSSAVIRKVAHILTSLRAHSPLSSQFWLDCRQLVGLGAGLTPSGDDLLVGLSAALHWLGVQQQHQFSLLSHATATTDVASVFHFHAERGRYSERLLNLFSSQQQATQVNPSI